MDQHKLNRRGFMRSAGLVGLAGVFGGGSNSAMALADGDTVTLPFANGERKIAQYPQKSPLILLTSRALQLETPLEYFNKGVITSNSDFFVRYHNTKIPLSIDPARYRLKVTGNVSKPLTLSLNDLKKKFTPVEITAACVCTGNSRGFNTPRVTGGQWAHGAMGNARWTGARLKDVLATAGLGAAALEVTFNGMDQGAKSSVPDFIKSLKVDEAINGDVILAYAMNGVDIPMLNGFPVRLVVPGYTGTYWVKHLTEISVINTVFSEFYMGTAYREPDNDCACVPPGTAPATTRPVSFPRTRSLITNLIDGAMVQTGAATTVRGFAFDLKSGLKSVLLSVDGGATWQETTLGEDLGKYSFRAWETAFTPGIAGAHSLKVKAVANSGETQPETQYWQPTGYGYNPIETVNVTAI